MQKKNFMLFDHEDGGDQDDGEDDENNCKQVRLSSYVSTTASTKSSTAMFNELGLEDAIAQLDETRKVAEAMSKIQSNYYEA